ncbi:MAG: bifunctional diaminohydroxyphosphoribosylaminopyrimidine deaminase/5-amino-6-(5-phosphoribosylamino)uracil reductase RibD [Alphaproteobacteria bacterium]|nr:bifunctional diaminohydroxyphosphoribosylaminopyrimidine deaminase/5-amino-6-(5-phosphoribosylamino)uracil reductase RibD [Alphaproteobacteria bacterium]MBV9552736.1 bifunctional diaminohydroxyphosphoribosylaminopyrimidine deaminase/5-amino-6-(5-phosphoribosylamino)uracil reductase RibD [Alphaproteobacteria bacterium]
MRAALTLARRGLGTTWPNPAVGCVVVKDGRVVGRGWTQPGGRPHAETEALLRAGDGARGATAYVTLEPCSHHGKTAPCADALVAAGISRVVAAIEDPDPRVAGAGLARLRAAGVAVETGLCAAAASEINHGFFLRLIAGRPLVTLKLATSLDGRIATATGESRWITGPQARARAHLLRATHDAVLIGTGTALADDPELTCRLPGLEARSPVRIVLDRGRRLPPTLRLFADAGRVPTWLVTAVPIPPPPSAAIRMLAIPSEGDAGLDLAGLLRRLGEEGLTRVLVEGGGNLAAALLRAELVDRVVWMGAPLVLGGDSIAAVAPLALAGLGDAPRLTLLSRETAGGDVIDTYAVERRSGPAGAGQTAC